MSNAKPATNVDTFTQNADEKAAQISKANELSRKLRKKGKPAEAVAVLAGFENDEAALANPRYLRCYIKALEEADKAANKDKIISLLDTLISVETDEKELGFAQSKLNALQAKNGNDLSDADIEGILSGSGDFDTIDLPEDDDPLAGLAAANDDSGDLKLADDSGADIGSP